MRLIEVQEAVAALQTVLSSIFQHGIILGFWNFLRQLLILQYYNFVESANNVRNSSSQECTVLVNCEFFQEAKCW